MRLLSAILAGASAQIRNMASNGGNHAVGRRVRTTPITPEKVMRPDEQWASGDSAIGINDERASVPTQFDA